MLTDSPAVRKRSPITITTAETITQIFPSGWIDQFGVPSVITTNTGQQFKSLLFKELTNLLGCSTDSFTSYHPEVNGLVERFHRTLKTTVTAQLDHNQWERYLPLVLLGLGSAVKTDWKCSSVELVYGTTLTLPGQLVINTPINISSIHWKTFLLHVWIVFSWNQFEMRLLNLRIIFKNFYLLRTFFLILVVFVLFLLHYISAKFRLWPSSGDLIETSDRNAESCNRIPSNYCLPYLSIAPLFW